MKQRFAVVWLACFGLALASGGGTLLVLTKTLAEPQRSALLEILAARAALLSGLILLAAIACGFIAHWIAQACFTPLQRYADRVRLIANGNSAYRVEAHGCAELQHLGTAINELAARHEITLREVSARIAQAQQSLLIERSHLATLMSELAQCVIVCNAEGQILLYNEKARALFSMAPAASDRHAAVFLGLGRSIYALGDADALRAALADLRRRAGLNELNPQAEFDMHLANGQRAQARMAIARHQTASGADGKTVDGFVLLLSAADTTGAAAPPEPTATVHAHGRPVYYDFDLFHQAGQSREMDDRPLASLMCTAFDTETTGLDPSAGDEIISIGAVRILNARLLPNEHYAQLIDPRRALDPDSIAVHGLTQDTLAGQPTIDKVLPAFFRFCEDTVLVGHNAAFDMRLLAMKQRTTGVVFKQPVLDTLLLSAAVHGSLQEHSLEAIAARLGVAMVDRHTALGDAITTANVFLKMLPLLARQGIVTLGHARRASAQTPYAQLRY